LHLRVLGTTRVRNVKQCWLTLIAERTSSTISIESARGRDRNPATLCTSDFRVLLTHDEISRRLKPTLQYGHPLRERDMMKRITFIVAMLGCGLLLSGCGDSGASAKKAADDAAKASQKAMDKARAEMEEKSKAAGKEIKEAGEKTRDAAVEAGAKAKAAAEDAAETVKEEVKDAVEAVEDAVDKKAEDKPE